ncbi:hypothetical protein EV715DRAFT_160044, partial [Schizophyllum commune]
APANPMYEEYMWMPGAGRRREGCRAIPPDLSKRDAKILKSVQRQAHHLDKGPLICGLRFGCTLIIGIIPMAGDITNAALNHTLGLRKAKQAELPSWLMQRMLVNNAISA